LFRTRAQRFLRRSKDYERRSVLFRICRRTARARMRWPPRRCGSASGSSPRWDARWSSWSGQRAAGCGMRSFGDWWA